MEFVNSFYQIGKHNFYHIGYCIFMAQAPIAFTQWMNSILKIRNLSVRQAAEMIGVSHPTLSNILNGEQPSFDTAKKIAESFEQPYLLVLEESGLLPKSSNNQSVRDQVIDMKKNELTAQQKDEVINFIEFIQDRDDKKNPKRALGRYTVISREGETPPEMIND